MAVRKQQGRRSPKRGGASQKQAARGGFARFFRTVMVSAAVSFAAMGWVLHAQFPDRFNVDQVLALGRPGRHDGRRLMRKELPALCE